jgi:hypothetical protein
MVCAGFIKDSSEDVELFRGMASLYPISVGTLSEVIPGIYELYEVRSCLIASLRTVATWPCLDYVYVLGIAAVYSCHAYSTSA